MSIRNSYTMAPSIQIGKIEGLQEVGKLLKNLPIELREKVAQKALKSALEPLLTEVIRRAPVGETGNLVAAIKLRAPKPRKNLNPWASVIALAPHAHLVEFGHKQIKRTLTGDVQTGTVPEHPFMRPALDSHAAKTTELLVAHISFWIQKLEGRANRL